MRAEHRKQHSNDVYYVLAKKSVCMCGGAPALSVVCTYCGAATGLNMSEAISEYPVLAGKEARLDLETGVVPTLFGVLYGGMGLLCILSVVNGNEEDGMFLVLGILFFIIGVIALCAFLCAVVRHVTLKLNGKIIKATVCGYMDDKMSINHVPAQIVKLLVQTPNGPRFILYRLGNTLRPYGINDTINIMVYKNYYLICKYQEVMDW